jgi:hypothetical protein
MFLAIVRRRRRTNNNKKEKGRKKNSLIVTQTQLKNRKHSSEVIFIGFSVTSYEHFL